MKRAIVLGGSGFIGTALVERLRRGGTDVLVAGRSGGAGHRPDLQGDLNELDLVSAFAEVDTVFHLAGAGSVPPSLEDPLGDLREQVGLTLRVLEAVRRCATRPRVVVASSAAVYGDSVRLPMDEGHPTLPLSPYGVSKLAIEHYVRVYHHLHGIEAVSARLFSVYGPGQRKLVVYDLLRRMAGGEDPMVIQAPADVARDFIFVDDVAVALEALALHADAVGEVYNVGSGEGTSLDALVQTMIAVTGATPTVRFSGALRPGDPVRWFADVSRLRALGVPPGTALADGLAATYDWYRHDPIADGS